MNDQNSSTLIAETKSTHRVETFILGQPAKHNNADTLVVFKIADTDYVYVAKQDEWMDKIGKLVCWIPPDSIVDMTRPEFSFLAATSKDGRVRAKKIRGIVSYGLLIPAPEKSELSPGDDAALLLSVKHYDPEINNTKNKSNSAGSEAANAPSGVYPKYDVDSGMKYANKVFTVGEIVYCSEKIHGCNSKFVYKDGQMYCGSREEWKKEYSSPPNITLEELITKTGDTERAKDIYEKSVLNFKPKKNMWWQILDKTPALRTFCESHPGWCVYGEIYGQVQRGYAYGITPGSNEFRAFDILMPTESGGRWLDAQEFMDTCDQFNIPRVPSLGFIHFDMNKLLELAEGNSMVPGAKNIREGIVIRPSKERYDTRLGRVNLKLINPAYLERN